MAEDAVNSTRNMRARCGRASYTNVISQIEPDPGAKAVAIWLRAIYKTFYGKN